MMNATNWQSIKPKPDPAAKFWDTKHPEAPITYEGRPLPGSRTSYLLDVRRFVWADDVVLKSFLKTCPDREIQEARAATTVDAAAWAIQKWTARAIRYVGDESIGSPEFWLFPAETLVRRKGDCEDGAILTVSLCRALGIPDARIRVAAGLVSAGSGADSGGHAWATLRRECDDEWVALDWCYLPDPETPVAGKIPLKARTEYFGGGQVWFSFHDLKAWTHEEDLIVKGRLDPSKGSRRT